MRLKVKWSLLWSLGFFLVCTFVLLIKSESYSEEFHTTSEKSLGQLAPNKYVTKSMAELGKMDEMNGFMLFFNYIPNEGAEILIHLLQKLQGLNGFRHIRLDRKIQSVMEEDIVTKVYDLARDEAVPLSFDLNMHFLNFTQFNRQSPTFINLVRDPAVRILSRLKNRNTQKRQLINCVKRKKEKCLLLNAYYDNLKDISYFCGQEQECRSIDKRWAVQRAKSNIEQYYRVVGTLEEFNTTLTVLEDSIPFFFKGVEQMYATNMLGTINEAKKKNILNKDETKLLQSLPMVENEFYQWIRKRLFKQLALFQHSNNINKYSNSNNAWKTD